MDYKKYIAERLNIDGVEKQEIENSLTVPPNTDIGDYALPCFKFAKILHKSPMEICENLKNGYVTDKYVVSVNALNGYLNFVVNRNAFAEDTIKEILSKGDNYGSSSVGNGKTVCIDYSSINIAKPFHIGHLSTTVLGGALYKIYNFLGYKSVGINHLGDYGTQFGKLIYAYKEWGKKEDVEKAGLKELTRLYVKYHEESETHPEMDDMAREYFKRIENGEKEEVELFNWFKAMTLKEVDKIYKKLNITFDSYAGESFYNDKMEPVINELKEKGLLIESEGAQVVDLEKYDMPPCIILRSDGASLYATRDLAAAFYRKNTYDFDKCLYVVAYQQNLHFKQIFKVLELMGKPWAKDMVHVAYGMVSLEDGAMSTRHGKVVLLEDLLDKSVEKAKAVIEQKNPDLEDKDKIAEIVGTGAVIFGALQNNKIKDIVFSYDKALNFDGETAPYVQYTGARCNSVLNKGGEIGNYTVPEMNADEYNLVNELSRFTDVVLSAGEKYEPSIIARYAIDLAEAYNKFYFDCKILGEEENLKNFRLALTKATGITLKNAFRLLGIEIPNRM